MIKRYPYKFTAFLFFIIFCTLSFIVYLNLGSGSINSLVEQMLHREQIIARSGAKSITSFIDLSTKSLLILANDENLTPQKLEDFIQNWSGTPVTGILLGNRQGIVINISSNVENLSPGANITDRDYFIDAQTSPPQKIIIGKPVISRAPGANQNYKVPVAIPIFKNGQFDGVLAIFISVPLLSKNYLEPLKISDETDIVLIDNQGNFLGSHHPEIIGDNIQNYVINHPFLGDKIVASQIENKIKNGGEQKLDIAIPDLSNGKITRTLVALSPLIVAGGDQWILAVTTPVDDALIFISPFILRNLLGIIVSFFISILITLFLFNRFVKN